MRSLSWPKVAFVFSLVVFGFLYGFGARARGWFPDDILTTAWRQARAVVAPGDEVLPHFVHPRVYETSGVRVLEPAAVQPGLTLIATYWKEFGWKTGLKLIDIEGGTVHRWPIEPDRIFSGEMRDHWGRRGGRKTGDLSDVSVHGMYLFPNGDVLVNLSGVGTARLDACGGLIWRLPANNHHSISRTDGGSFWIGGLRFDRPPMTSRYPDGLPGLGEPLDHDLLLRVSEGGEILQEINAFDVMYDNGLQRHVLKGSHAPNPGESKRGDLTHMNDIEPLSASSASEYPLFAPGDLAVSLRDLDLVFVVDPRSERVKWHASRPFIGQHDPDFIGDGWIGVFDNNRDGTFRGTMLGGSRIVALQPHSDSVRVLFPTSSSEPFYTKAEGHWQELENGNLLLTESFAGRVVEVAPDGRTVWEWKHEPYSDSLVAEVPEAVRHDLTPAEAAAWPCSQAASASETNSKEESAW